MAAGDERRTGTREARIVLTTRGRPSGEGMHVGAGREHLRPDQETTMNKTDGQLKQDIEDLRKAVGIESVE